MKKRIRMRRRIAAFLMGLIVCANLIPRTAYAYSRIDTEKETSLTLEYDFADVMFRIYRVAEVSDAAQYTLTGEFAGYPVDLTSPGSETWRTLANTLNGYVERDKISPLAENKTDADGNLTFAGLQTGLYLVIGEEFESGDYRYAPTAFLLNLPDLTTSDEWEYHPVVQPKQEQEVKRTQYRAVKLWKDAGHEKQRPKQITAQLLKDGVIYDEKVLNAANGWQYTWSDLEVTSRWTVTEKEVGKGYTVSVGKEGSTFLITNTYKSAKPENPGGNTPSKLPQTGQLWWPVAICAGIGVLCVILGLVFREKKD